jgi:hypothetical protein
VQLVVAIGKQESNIEHRGVGSSTEQQWQLKGKGMLHDHFWSGCTRKSERRTLELWSFSYSNNQWQGKAGSNRYDDLKNLLRWRMLFEFGSGLGSLISWVFKLGSEVKGDEWKMDSSEIKINIFSLLLGSTILHAIKGVTHYCRLHTVGGKSALNKRILVN